MDNYNEIELCQQLCLLWALYELGGWADDDILFPKYKGILETAINNHWGSREIIDKMIELGYPKDDLEYFLIKTHGLSVSLDNITLH